MSPFFSHEADRCCILAVVASARVPTAQDLPSCAAYASQRSDLLHASVSHKLSRLRPIGARVLCPCGTLSVLAAMFGFQATASYLQP
jgi:hypothetical protein